MKIKQKPSVSRWKVVQTLSFLLLFLVLLCSNAQSTVPVPYDETIHEAPSNIAPSDDFHHFDFETASDELSIALQKLYAAYITAPSQENLIELDTLRSQGKTYLLEHPTEAAEALLAEASQLDASNVQGLMVIIHFFGHFESQEGINYLYNRANNMQAGNCSFDEDYCSRLRGVRYLALEALGRISSMGSALAKEKMLALVSSPDETMQRKAIGLFYETGGMSRWRAKREMAKQLPVSKHFLLYEIY